MCNNEAKLVYLNCFKNKHMKYKTSLQDVEFHAYHGVYEEETLMGGKFIVNASVLVYRTASKNITVLEDATNYEIIYKIMHVEMQKTVPLIETVAQRIVNQLKAEFTEAREIEVSIVKPRAGGLLPSGDAVVSFEWKAD
jgi:dihydroneopterin aldolase